ncbi:MAG: metallopeptidase TldD-related protein [Candidatus Sungiibacteriota bacterium]
MKTLKELRDACVAVLEFLRSQDDIADAQVFVSANEHVLSRINYTSHILSNGVEEPKATQNFGTGLTVVFKDDSTGSGSAESSLSLAGAREALAKARISAVKDPEFYGLPKPEFGKRTLRDYHDAELMELADASFVKISWDILRAALDAFEASPVIRELSRTEGLAKLKLIIGGDVQLIRERMAIASFAMPDVESDESSMCVTSVTAMIEAKNAKGSGFFAGKSLEELKSGGPTAAKMAIDSAIATMSGERIESGDYIVVFGPQAVAELVNNLVAPGLTSGAIFAEGSPFQGEFLKDIASPLLSIYDDGANPEFMGAKGVTCEGLPTGRTDLVWDGKFVGLLSSHYDYQRMLRDPEYARKLGAAPSEHKTALWPRNGFRFSGGAGRHFTSDPSCSGSNIIITSSGKEPLEKLLSQVGNGVYIGRMWYVYPINGARAGDFTGTVTADSYLIENGKLSRPLKPNAVRVNDNIKGLLMRIAGVSDRLKAVNLWGADEAMYAPDILVEGVHLDSIAESLELTSGG